MSDPKKGRLFIQVGPVEADVALGWDFVGSQISSRGIQIFIKNCVDENRSSFKKVSSLWPNPDQKFFQPQNFFLNIQSTETMYNIVNIEESDPVGIVLFAFFRRLDYSPPTL